MTTVLWFLYSQADTPGIPPGWVGAGLLGSVLAWLMFVHLPAKDKLIKDLIQAFREELAAERETRDRNVERLTRMVEALAYRRDKDGGSTP